MINDIAKEFSDYLLAAKSDIEEDNNVLHFATNREGFEYLESIMK